MRQPTSSVTIDSPNHPANLTALWDTGATESYIDHQAATQFADLSDLIRTQSSCAYSMVAHLQLVSSSITSISRSEFTPITPQFPSESTSPSYVVPTLS
jgi:hypothetical protein